MVVVVRWKGYRVWVSLFLQELFLFVVVFTYRHAGVQVPLATPDMTWTCTACCEGRFCYELYTSLQRREQGL